MKGTVVLTLAMVGLLGISGCRTLDRLGAGECRTENNCAGEETCLAPYSPSVCGACFTAWTPCSMDADCDAVGTGLICDTFDCACDFTDLDCVPGCTGDESCRPGQACGADLRCAPRACTGASDCPESEFDCDPGGLCARRSCNGDADCIDDGFCIYGSCYERPGTCQGLVP